MTMFGLGWGLKLQGVSSLGKLVAIRLGDGCDQEANGASSIEQLSEWCGATRAEILEAMETAPIAIEIALKTLHELSPQ